jgi:hypothetical protein
MTAELSQESGLTVIEPTSQDIVKADPARAVDALENYRLIQAALDKQMPDCIMEIGDKKFRKKVYWRAIATAFNLELELKEERREEVGGDWGYLVTYRATANNGRTCDGDGACFVSEKRGNMATVHNVRAHAHTRAKNRAISDLVGFGEVSAEEVNYSAEAKSDAATPDPQPSTARTASGGPVKMASTQKVKRMWAKSYARAEQLTGDKKAASAILTEALAGFGLELPARGDTAQFPDSAAEAIFGAIERVEINANGEAYTPQAQDEAF